MNLQYEVIEAAGGLLWRISGDLAEVALIHRARYDDWTLPKGKREPGESWMATALREVREETCCEVEPLSYAGCTSYLVRAVPKVVMFWNMRLLAEHPFEANDETDELRWTTVENSLVLLTYPAEKELLRGTLREDSPT